MQTGYMRDMTSQADQHETDVLRDATWTRCGDQQMSGYDNQLPTLYFI
jgi:hypothetical protein